MPMATKEEQRAYQRKWLKKRRNAWLHQNGPCKKCDSPQQLHIDHINPKIKSNHRIWSWTQARRDDELKKCQVLCRDCHQQKTNSDNNFGLKHGTESGYSYYGCRCRPRTDAKVKKVEICRRKTPKDPVRSTRWRRRPVKAEG